MNLNHHERNPKRQENKKNVCLAFTSLWFLTTCWYFCKVDNFVFLKKLFFYTEKIFCSFLDFVDKKSFPDVAVFGIDPQGLSKNLDDFLHQHCHASRNIENVACRSPPRQLSTGTLQWSERFFFIFFGMGCGLLLDRMHVCGWYWKKLKKVYT